MNPRVRMFNRLANGGNCSMEIDLVRLDDTGIYQLNISIDYQIYTPYPFVAVIVQHPPDYYTDDDDGEDDRDKNKNDFPLYVTLLIIVGIIFGVVILAAWIWNVCRFLH